MARFVLTKKALADLLEIGRYTEEHWGKDQRNMYLAKIDACFHQLADRPQLGKSCSEIRDGYRKMSVGSHIVFYRQKTDTEIEIVRVLHGRMDFDSLLDSH